MSQNYLAHNADKVGLVAIAGNDPQNHAVVCQAGGQVVFCVTADGEMATGVKDWDTCTRLRSTDAITSHDGKTIHLWDVFEDLPGFKIKGRWMYIPEGTGPLIKRSIELWVKNQSYAELTLGEFLRKLVGEEINVSTTL